jgi:glucokinase
VIVGGGLTKVGPELWHSIRRKLDSWASESPFLDALDVPRRVVFGAPIAAVAAVGAALLEEAS